MEKEALFSALSLEVRRFEMYDLKDIDAYQKYFFAGVLTAAKAVMKVILEEVKEAETFDRAEAARAEFC